MVVSECCSVLDLGLDETVELLNRGFSDYIVPVQFDLAGWLHMVVGDGIDLGSSWVLVRDGMPIGCALIAQRGWSSRLAAMAVVPEARGQGVGRALMDRVIEDARSRRQRRLVLEVIESNDVAVHLYKGCGFRVVRRLLSYSLNAGQAGEAADLEDVDPREVARMVTVHGLPDMPWQISGESLAHLGPPSRGVRLDQAYALISDPEREQIGIRALVVERGAPEREQAVKLLQGLIARYPGKAWRVPALLPEELGGHFEAVGFVRGELAQLQLLLGLSSRAVDSMS
jgi:GNAT superfamily N-acetyltransferase